MEMAGRWGSTTQDFRKQSGRILSSKSSLITPEILLSDVDAFIEGEDETQRVILAGKYVVATIAMLQHRYPRQVSVCRQVCQFGNSNVGQGMIPVGHWFPDRARAHCYQIVFQEAGG